MDQASWIWPSSDWSRYVRAPWSSPGEPPQQSSLELLGDDELAEQILAQDLAATVRGNLESAYPTYLARLGQMLGQEVDEESAA